MLFVLQRGHTYNPNDTKCYSVTAKISSLSRESYYIHFQPFKVFIPKIRCHPSRLAPSLTPSRLRTPVSGKFLGERKLVCRGKGLHILLYNAAIGEFVFIFFLTALFGFQSQRSQKNARGLCWRGCQCIQRPRVNVVIQTFPTSRDQLFFFPPSFFVADDCNMLQQLARHRDIFFNESEGT